MKNENTSIRLKRIMAEKSLKQKDILRLCKPICDRYNNEYNLNIQITKSDLSQWISGIYEPSQRKLTILAEALNTTEVWLMGYDVKDISNNNNSNNKKFFVSIYSENNNKDLINRYLQNMHLLNQNSSLTDEEYERFEKLIKNNYELIIFNSIDSKDKYEQ